MISDPKTTPDSRAGRVLFAAVVAFGARTSLLVGGAAALVASLLGTLVGLTAGYFGGWYDAIASRVIDVLFGLARQMRWFARAFTMKDTKQLED